MSGEHSMVLSPEGVFRVTCAAREGKARNFIKKDAR